MKHINTPKPMSGFSMIELMISVTIGLLLTAAVLQTFVSMKRTYEFNEEFSRIQQNGRFAMNYLTRDVRMAGHFGCFSRNFDSGKIEINLDADKRSDIAWDTTRPLLGYDNVTSSFNEFEGVVAGTDVIVIKSVSSSSFPLMPPGYNQGANMDVHIDFNEDCGGGSDCHEGEILMVSDCSKAKVFQATNIENKSSSKVLVTHSGAGYEPGNSHPVFQNSDGSYSQGQHADGAFKEGSFISRLESYAYYIRNSDSSGEPSLYRSRLGLSKATSSVVMSAEELVEGVEDMQIFYGEDTSGNGSPNYFVPADEVVDMGDVVSIQINLMVRSLRDYLTEAPASKTLSGTSLATASDQDRRIRKEFSAQIALRNRLK